mmetsp:Transcript_25705/g.56003  ORF Transcript_25705/g.56003 Transcript_25705/m.56003 type:complete len:280 (-) Transcript_25705:34-873(-)
MAGGNGGHQGGVQAARQQHAKRHVAHHALLDRGLKGGAQRDQVQGGAGEALGLGLVVQVELGVEVALELPGLAAVVVAGGELLEAGAVILDALHLGGQPHAAVPAPADVHAGDSQGVTCRVEAVCVLVQHHKGKEAVKHGGNLLAMQLVQVADHLAVAVGGKLLVGLFVQDVLTQRLVVVNLAVDRDADGLVLVEQGLVARCWVHNCQALVCQEVVSGLMHARPVGTTMALPPAQCQQLCTHRWGIICAVEHSQDAAHFRRFSGFALCCARHYRNEELS